MNIEEIMAKMSAIVTRSDAEKRSLTDDEVVEYEGLEADLAKARKDVEVRSRHTAYTTPVTNPVQTADKDHDDTLDRAFESYLRTGQQNMDLVELRAQSEGTPSAGGYMVPDGFRNKLIEVMKSFGGLESAAEVITTESGNTIEWPTLDDTANEGEIAAEGVAGVSGDDLVFGTNSLGAYKYTSLGASNLELKVSIELLQDSAFDVTALVTRALGRRIARKMATDFVNGTGSGEPLGILTAASDVVGTSGLLPTYGDIVALIHAVDPAYRQGAKFLASDGAIAALQSVVDGNDRPLWMPSTGGLGNALPEGTMLGYPVILDQAMPTASPIVNDENWLIFGNLREAYVIRHVKGISVLVDPYTYAKEGQVGFVAFARADGTIQNAAAYAQLEGTT